MKGVALSIQLPNKCCSIMKSKYNKFGFSAHSDTEAKQFSSLNLINNRFEVRFCMVSIYTTYRGRLSVEKDYY